SHGYRRKLTATGADGADEGQLIVLDFAFPQYWYLRKAAAGQCVFVRLRATCALRFPSVVTTIERAGGGRCWWWLSSVRRPPRRAGSSERPERDRQSAAEVAQRATRGPHARVWGSLWQSDRRHFVA